MVELNIKKLLGLKSLNAITEKEFKSELDTKEKKDFIEFLSSIPKDNIPYLFSEEEEKEKEEEEEF